jgi:lactam utilization protein B
MMEHTITIHPDNKKAIALLDKLHEKKQEVKKQMQDSPLVKKLRSKPVK